MDFSVQEVYEQGSGKLNEDSLFIKENLFAVFDGATSLIDTEQNRKKTGGRIAAETAEEVFSKESRPLKDMILAVNSKLQEKMQKAGVDLSKPESRWGCAAAAVRVNEDNVEYAQIGDCTIVLIKYDGTFALPAGFEEHDKELLTMWKKLANKETPNIFEELLPQIIKLRRTANKKYGVIDGQPEAKNFIKWGTFRIVGVKSIILLTDGLLIPQENPEEFVDWEIFVKLYQKARLKGILNYVRSKEDGDPNCWLYPRYKLHDDVAAIGIDFD